MCDRDRNRNNLFHNKADTVATSAVSTFTRSGSYPGTCRAAKGSLSANLACAAAICAAICCCGCITPVYLALQRAEHTLMHQVQALSRQSPGHRDFASMSVRSSSQYNKQCSTSLQSTGSGPFGANFGLLRSCQVKASLKLLVGRPLPRHTRAVLVSALSDSDLQIHRRAPSKVTTHPPIHRVFGQGQHGFSTATCRDGAGCATATSIPSKWTTLPTKPAIAVQTA